METKWDDPAMEAVPTDENPDEAREAAVIDVMLENKPRDLLLILSKDAIVSSNKNGPLRRLGEIGV